MTILNDDDSAMLAIANTVDLKRYPIVDLTCAQARALVDACHQQLADNGLCLLPNFIHETALQIILHEAQGLLTSAHHTEHWRAAPNGASADDNSVLAQTTRASIAAIAYDLIADDSLLRQLYQWEGLADFINALFDPDNSPDGLKFYRSDDPLVACMLSVMHNDDELGWHYDPNDGVVSLLLQAPEQGGEFEFAPAIRAPAAHAMHNEQAVLTGDYEPLVRLQIEPGTLVLFNGHRSLHRVTPVVGERARIIALFNYADRLNYRFSDAIQQRFFGRIA